MKIAVSRACLFSALASLIAMRAALCSLTGSPMPKLDFSTDCALYDLVNPKAGLISPNAVSSRHYATPADEPACVLNASYKVEAQYPSCDIEQPESECLPTGITLELSELLQILPASPRLAVVACRRILEKACKVILKENTGKKSLYD